MAGRRRTYEEVRLLAAHRRAGQKWWKWYVLWKPALTRGGPPAGAAALLGLAWWKVPHIYLGIGTLTVAAVLAVGWLAYQGSGAALQRRMTDRAAGPAPRGAGLGWAVGVIVALLGVTSWLTLWSPYA